MYYNIVNILTGLSNIILLNEVMAGVYTIDKSDNRRHVRQGTHLAQID